MLRLLAGTLLPPSFLIEKPKMQTVAQTILNSCSELPGCRLKCRQEPAGLLDHQVPVALCGLNLNLFIPAFTLCDHLVHSPPGYSQLGEAVTAQVRTPTPELTFLAEP